MNWYERMSLNMFVFVTSFPSYKIHLEDYKQNWALAVILKFYICWEMLFFASSIKWILLGVGYFNRPEVTYFYSKIGL